MWEYQRDTEECMYQLLVAFVLQSLSDSRMGKWSPQLSAFFIKTSVTSLELIAKKHFAIIVWYLLKLTAFYNFVKAIEYLDLRHLPPTKEFINTNYDAKHEHVC